MSKWGQKSEGWEWDFYLSEQCLCTPDIPALEAECQCSLNIVYSTINPSESSIWQDLGHYRDGIRTNGESGKSKKYYEWDYTHGEIEVYDRYGTHEGAIDPTSGEKVKEEGRTIDI